MKETLNQFIDILCAIIRQYEQMESKPGNMREQDERLEKYVNRKLRRALVEAVRDRNMELAKFIKAWLGAIKRYAWHTGWLTFCDEMIEDPSIFFIPGPGLLKFATITEVQVDKYAPYVRHPELNQKDNDLLASCSLPELITRKSKEL